MDILLSHEARDTSRSHDNVTMYILHLYYTQSYYIERNLLTVQLKCSDAISGSPPYVTLTNRSLQIWRNEKETTVLIQLREIMEWRKGSWSYGSNNNTPAFMKINAG